jgi:multidrug efflux pump subunit AcrB
MESEKMMAVFSELLDKQKEIMATQKDELIILRKLSNEMEEMKISIQNQKAEIVPVDLKPIQQVVEKGISDIRIFLLTQQQKPGSNNWRVFMESDAKKWAAYLIMAVTFLTYLYLFATHKKG